MSDTNKYLSPESLDVVREWVCSQQSEAEENIGLWSGPQTVTMHDGSVVTGAPAPDQVEAWTARHAMLSGVLSALDELTERREVMKIASRSLDNVEKHLTA